MYVYFVYIIIHVHVRVHVQYMYMYSVHVHILLMLCYDFVGQSSSHNCNTVHVCHCLFFVCDCCAVGSNITEEVLCH